MEYKRPVRRNCWVITIICCLHFNFEYYFFNNKGAGIVSEPGERRELGLPAVAAPRVLTAMLDQRGWHISRSRILGGDYCPLLSKDRTQQKKKAVGRVVKPGRSVIRAQGFVAGGCSAIGITHFKGEIKGELRVPSQNQQKGDIALELSWSGFPTPYKVYPHLVW